MRIGTLQADHLFIADIAAEGDGRLAVRVVSATLMLHLQHDAARGNAEAAKLVPVVVAAVMEIAKPPPDRLPHCAVCGTAIGFYPGYHVGVVMADVASPSVAITFLVCNGCCWDQETLDAEAARIVRRHWPDDGAVRMLGASDAPDRTSTGGGQT